MSDKELLEMAAKAAGITDFEYCELVGGSPALYCRDEQLGMWAPLIDDGDALRLAVKIGMLIDARFTRPEALRYNEVMYWPTLTRGKTIPYGDREDDPYAATRRAIVRAAAEIGKSLSISPSEGAKRE